MTKPRYFSKTRFKLGYECQTKLYYSDHRDEYADVSLADPFLEGLAEGGFQVGALARWRLCRNPAGDLIKPLGHADALAETARRLKAQEATIAEAAFAYESLFIRVDVLVKKGDTLKLYEVKSKSWDSSASFWSRRGERRLHGDWESEMLDVAFQKHVLAKACPGMKVEAFLVLVDKGKKASVDGLNQLFLIIRDGARFKVEARVPDKAALGDDILVHLNVDNDLNEIDRLAFTLGDGSSADFAGLVKHLAAIHAAGRQAFCGVGSKCKSCQFRHPADADERAALEKRGLKSGRDECWRNAAGARFRPGLPTVLEIWNCRKTDELVAAKKYFIADLRENDLGESAYRLRQQLQVDKVLKGDGQPWLDKAALAREMGRWKYPLHFIDFETSRVAIPFNRALRPYEQIAFQFSHHAVDRDGKIRHAGQWLEATPGKFPNFDFIRELKRSLEVDDGTIFRYASHENTVLNEICAQLAASSEPGKDDLIEWIRSITEHHGSGAKRPEDKICGPRNMVDMRALVVKHHYDPYTRGSNSLKAVLPAVIHSSPSLRRRYGASIREAGVHSLNFPPGWIWIGKGRDGDPYHALPPLFKGDEAQALSKYVQGLEDIDEGGAAMIAYAKLQFAEIPASEREAIRNGLLRYCELDTLAMVMLYEYWRDGVRG